MPRDEEKFVSGADPQRAFSGVPRAARPAWSPAEPRRREGRSRDGDK